MFSMTEQDEIRATRKDWLVLQDGAYIRVSSAAGWGNAGTRNIELHLDAMRKRAERKFAKTLDYPHRVELTEIHQYGDGVTYAVGFRAYPKGE